MIEKPIYWRQKTLLSNLVQTDRTSSHLPAGILGVYRGALGTPALGVLGGPREGVGLTEGLRTEGAGVVGRIVGVGLWRTEVSAEKNKKEKTTIDICFNRWNRGLLGSYIIFLSVNNQQGIFFFLLPKLFLIAQVFESLGN